MSIYHSPCVSVLGDLADSTAKEYRRGQGVRTGVDRGEQLGFILIPLPDGQIVHSAINSPEAMSEVIREMLVLQADLLKMWGKKT